MQLSELTKSYDLQQHRWNWMEHRWCGVKSIRKKGLYTELSFPYMGLRDTQQESHKRENELLGFRELEGEEP